MMTYEDAARLRKQAGIKDWWNNWAKPVGKAGLQGLNDGLITGTRRVADYASTAGHGVLALGDAATQTYFNAIKKLPFGKAWKKEMEGGGRWWENKYAGWHRGLSRSNIALQKYLRSGLQNAPKAGSPTFMENAADLASDAGSLLLVGSTIGRAGAKAAVKGIPRLLPQAWRPFFTGGRIGGTMAAAGSAAPVADKITGFSTKAGERAGAYMRRALPWLQAVTPYAVATNYMASTPYAQKANARLVGSKLAELPYTMDAHGPIARTIAKNALPAVIDSDTAHMMEQVLNEKASGTKQYAAEQLRKWKGIAGGAAAETGRIVKGDAEEARRSAGVLVNRVPAQVQSTEPSAVSGTGRRHVGTQPGPLGSYNTNGRRVPAYSGAERLPEGSRVVLQYPKTVYDRLPEQYRDEIKGVVEDPRVKRITDEVRRFYGPEANAMINRFQGRIPTVPRLFGRNRINVAPYIAQTSFTNDIAGEAAKTLTEAELLRRDIKNKVHKVRTYPQRTAANIARDKLVETISRMKQ